MNFLFVLTNPRFFYTIYSMDKIKINEVILVEGKYDKIKLDSIVDATVIAVNGFSLFKNKDMKQLIRRYAETRGIIVFTDSDSGGLLIRRHLQQIVPPEYIKNAYIPQIPGKEKRKIKPGKAGLLGVEGVPNDVILTALTRCATAGDVSASPITKFDLLSAGLSGGKDSAEKRKALLKSLDLPENLSANAFLSAINAFMTREEFESYLNKK